MERSAVGRLVTAMGGALFPPLCPGCRAETAEPQSLCQSCWSDTEFIAGAVCDTCGRPVTGLPATEPGFRCDECLRNPPEWDRARGVLVYGGTGRRIVLALKHGDRLDVVPMLGQWAARTGEGLIADADLVVPIPLHWTRRLRRRFNQSAELARAALVAARRPEIYAPEVLRRVRRTASQDGRSRSERAENVADALAVAPGAEPLIRGKRILLVDDVMTTGATLSAAATVLRAAGAKSIDALVIALVRAPRDDYLRAEQRKEHPSEESEA
ncbi:ComF family protein [Thermohalobaculum xanthum]|nr:ComF family protein [Thermohalobaculum xanthum]